MANPAKEARDKAQIAWPGATVSGRGRGWIKHQHPTNSRRFMLDSHIGPIHYGAGEDSEIDTAWQVTTGEWQYEMTLNSFQTYARNIFNAGDIFEFQKDGEWLRFDPQSINWIDENTSRQQIAVKQAVIAVVDDDILRFPEGYGPGRHFQYQNQTARLQKLITIDALTDLPIPTVGGNEIWFEAEFSLSMSSGVNFWIDGVEWTRENAVRVQTADRIEIRNFDGSQVLWHLDYPRAFDSADNETIGQMEVRRQGGPSSLFITVRIPKTWIDSAIFPIYIDPTIDEQIGAGADDGHIRGSSTYDNSGGNIYVGQGPGVSNTKGWFRFPGISDLSGATVDVSYFEPRFSSDTGSATKSLIYADDSAAPTAPTSFSDYNSKVLTTTSVAWDDETGKSHEFVQSASINTIIQELADSYDPSAIQIMWLDNGSALGNYYNINTYEAFSTWGAKLHIEYTAANFQVSASSDDAFQDGGGVAADIVGASVRWNKNTVEDNFRGGCRWTGVTIPSGATIITATMDLYFYNADVDDMKCTLYAEDSSAPAAFSTAIDDLDRTFTTAGVLWDEANIGIGWATSPELKTIIQELVDSYDYSSGLAIAIISDDSENSDVAGWTKSYDAVSDLAAKLHIEFSEGGGVSTIVHSYRQRRV